MQPKNVKESIYGQIWLNCIIDRSQFSDITYTKKEREREEEEEEMPWDSCDDETKNSRARGNAKTRYCVCVCIQFAYLCVGARSDVDKNPEGNQTTDLDAKTVGFTLITLLLAVD